VQTPLPLTQDLVLAGGGHAQALVLRKWGMSPLPGVRLTLVSTGPVAPYTGMLPGYIAGLYTRDELEIDLVRLARFAGARFIQDQATGIDRPARELVLASGRRLRYDRLSLNIGATAALPDLPGYADHVTPARPLHGIADRWEAYLRSDASNSASIVVIGGGIGGAELALSMAHRLQARGTAARSITLVDRSLALPGVARITRAKLLAALAQAGVVVLEHAPVARVEADGVVLADDRHLPASLIIGTPGVTPQDWVAQTGLDLTNGFITVDPYLRSLSDPAIYASGDCAHLAHAPRPKAGVYAVRAAPVLAHNLASDLSGRARRQFHPQRDFLRLISLGPQRAIAQRGGLAVEGDWVWRWKDQIDRKFMNRLGRDLRPMQPKAPPARAANGLRDMALGQDPCAGCGAKVGSGPLHSMLGTLPKAPTRDDVLAPPGDDAATLRGTPNIAISTDHLRAFTQDEALLATIAAHHALSDIYAMGADPQAALSTIILPRMRAELRDHTLQTCMQAAAKVFAAAGAQIAGGHTTEGAEMTVGFTVTGVLSRAPIGLASARVGDRLILTKPLGSGTLLAGDMALKARGADVMHALKIMTQPTGHAAKTLKGAHAMTDVTGFGLAGHLANICKASHCGARLDLSAIPFLPGAEDLAASGVRSTLFEANRAAVADADLPNTSQAALLFDPQTAGGLLASVAAETAEQLLKDLKAAGYTAAIIGEMTKDGSISAA